MMLSCDKQPQTLKDLKSNFVIVDDSINVHYKTYGQCGKTICFVHGFGCDLNTWEKQFEAFRDEDVRLVFIDLPGYGQSDKPHVDYTLDFFAHAIDEVLDSNGVDSVIFVGHSLGTPVCRQTMMTAVHNGALVDIDGVYCFYDGTETHEYVEAVEGFGRAFDGPDCRDVITGFVMSLAGPDTPQEITDYAMSVMPETPQYVASSTMQNLVDRKWWNNQQICQPVMVICAQNSGLDPDNEQKMQALYPNLDYIELTSCGHFIHMEQPEMFNKKLKLFIENQYNTNNTMEQKIKFCQSCGMPLNDENRGTNADGSKNEDYCMYCYQNGKFTNDCTMDEMIEFCAQFVDEVNKNMPKPMTKDEYKDMMRQYFPMLKRWKK